MKFAALVAVFSVSLPLAAAQQPGAGRAQPAPASTDKVAEAYNQFLLGHRLEEADDVNGAVSAYKRAMELDPTAADIPGELAGLYLRQNKIQEAMATAEQALKVAQANREANRVLGTIYAALSESPMPSAARARAGTGAVDENLTKAIKHLEVATDHPTGQIDPNVRATLAR